VLRVAIPLAVYFVVMFLITFFAAKILGGALATVIGPLAEVPVAAGEPAT
jgi:ACR3 family arsenite efflux pump ArsB